MRQFLEIKQHHPDAILFFRVGDFYEAFGYGIALNVNRNVDIDIDTSIQGARVFWQPGAWDVTESTRRRRGRPALDRSSSSSSSRR